MQPSRSGPLQHLRLMAQREDYCVARWKPPGSTVLSLPYSSDQSLREGGLFSAYDSFVGIVTRIAIRSKLSLRLRTGI
jgi:hypothetical protein